MSRRIFISYRRGDDPAYAGRLFDSLQNAFGSDRLFMDVDNIEPGMDFLRVLEEEVARCDVLLAVIGSRWLDAQDNKGKRKLDNPKDFVRFEVEAALNQNKWVIPVLVGDAEMPDPEELPESLRMLAGRHAVRIKHERFKADARDLIERLRKLPGRPQPQAARKLRPPPAKPEPESVLPASEPLAPAAPAKRRFRRWIAAALILLAAGIGGVLWQQPDTVRAPAGAAPGAAVSNTGEVVDPTAGPRIDLPIESKRVKTLSLRAKLPAPSNDTPDAWDIDSFPSPEQPAAAVGPQVADRVAQPGPAEQIAPSPQLAILYDESPTDPNGTQYNGKAVWRTEQVNNFPAPGADIAVRADVEIPGRKLKMTLSFRRNTDASLPASHTAEFGFLLPPDFVGGGVRNVPGMLMQSSDQTRGTALTGVGVRLADSFFRVGLSNVEADIKKNLELLKTRAWLEVPLVYANQRRGVLAIEKGASGERAFAAAFAAWEQPSAAAAPVSTAPGAAAPVITGSYFVQLVSQRSEADAQAAYKALQVKFQAVLGPRTPLIKRTDLGDKGVYYRVTIGPFDTSDAAAQVCGNLKTAGGQCVVQKN